MMAKDPDRSMARDFESWSDERANVLRSSAADIKSRAVALGQWRTAFDCSYFTWAPRTMA